MPGNEISAELKEQALMRLLPPYSWSLRQIAKEVGTSPTTIMKWRRQLEDEGLLMPKEANSDDWSADQIFTFENKTWGQVSKLGVRNLRNLRGQI
jgi:transposase-like protein